MWLDDFVQWLFRGRKTGDCILCSKELRKRDKTWKLGFPEEDGKVYWTKVHRRCAIIYYETNTNLK